MPQPCSDTFRWLVLLLLLAGGWVHPAAALAQNDSIQIVLERPNDVGLQGLVRPGTWAPMRVTIRNTQSTLRTLMVDWISPDVDGDLVLARRENVVVPAGGSVAVRLYAMPATTSRPQEGWTVRAVDAETEQVVASIKVAPRHVLPLRTGAIGVVGGGLMGLASFRDTFTQHEPIEFITGIEPALLPDRWYGMSLLDALVWAPGRSPADPAVPIVAIREWVRRGGHLVVVLSAIDTGWSDPRLADLLPPVNIGPAVEIDAPHWLYETSDPVREVTQSTQVTGIKFSVRPLTRPATRTERDAALLIPTLLPEQSHGADEPTLIAAHQYGFGRVTVIGLDLTDRRMASNVAFVRYGLPRVWQTVFNWRSPANLDVATLVDQQKMVAPNARDTSDLGTFIPGRISMKSTASLSIVAAVLLFGVYWVVAGPVMYAALKARKMLQHSWLVFAGIVAIFSGITWAGAMLARPGLSEIEHFSIVDIDASSRGPAQVRVQSYFSLFVPEHGTIDVALQGKPDRANLSTLSSPGMPDGDKGGFVDVRQYAINALSPAATPALPMRSTAKQFEAHYSEVIDGGPLAQEWAAPQGRITLTDGWPAGRLTHKLPGPLRNVRLIYTPGDGAPAEYWNPDNRTWQPGADLFVLRPANKGLLVLPPMKVIRPQDRARDRTPRNPKPNGWEKRTLSAEGLLGAHLNELGGQRSDVKQDQETFKMIDPGASTIVRSLEIMSFFSMLPPPDFMVRDDIHFMWTPVHLTRRIARSADISHLTATRRLIILGHLEEDSPVPLPITVDGQEVSSRGWTMVRFILPVE